MREDSALLVSVKPVYVAMLLAGRKTVELRRTRPGLPPGAEVLIYASSPTRELVAKARIAEIRADTPDRIWETFGVATGLTRSGFDEYFEGARTAVAISLTTVVALEEGIPLSELRRRLRGFRPPQSFQYLPTAHAAALI